MKMRAKTQSYNVGYKEIILLYDTIASNPDEYIENAELLLAADAHHGLMENPKTGATVEQTFMAMDYYVENHYDWISTDYFEYKTSM